MNPIPPMAPMCTETALDRYGRHRRCIEDQGHDGDHQDVRGFRWEPQARTLKRLQQRWSGTHRIICTGHMWIATAHRDDAPWKTEVQPTPGQLEEHLERHGFTPTSQEQR